MIFLNIIDTQTTIKMETQKELREKIEKMKELLKEETGDNRSFVECLHCDDITIDNSRSNLDKSWIYCRQCGRYYLCGKCGMKDAGWHLLLEAEACKFCCFNCEEEYFATDEELEEFEKKRRGI